MLKSCESALGTPTTSRCSTSTAWSTSARRRAGRGDLAGPGARAGMRLAFVTNNAARDPRHRGRPSQRARRAGRGRRRGDLRPGGGPVGPGHVQEGPAVFVIGGGGPVVALEEQGLRPTQSLRRRSRAAVTGYHRDLRLGDGQRRRRPGRPAGCRGSRPTPTGACRRRTGWVRATACSCDAVARFAGRSRSVAGKPLPPLFEETVRRVGGGGPWWSATGSTPTSRAPWPAGTTACWC